MQGIGLELVWNWFGIGPFLSAQKVKIADTLLVPEAVTPELNSENASTELIAFMGY